MPTSTPPTENRQPTPTREEAAPAQAPVAAATEVQPPTDTPAPAQATQARATERPRATTQPTPTANAPPATVAPATVAVARASNLPTIAYADLPPEAHETIARIEAGGPFPFSRDGITFQNRERILPRHPEGYYKEYTVITPGSNDRGARRIVTGEAGEMYYTDDHYDSFSEILR